MLVLVDEALAPTSVYVPLLHWVGPAAIVPQPARHSTPVVTASSAAASNANGNTIDDGNGCSADCQGYAKCGNSVREYLEECDDGNDIEDDGCQVTCTADGACTEHFGAGAGAWSSPSLEACVCSSMPACCTAQWDAGCVAAVTSLGCGECP